LKTPKGEGVGSFNCRATSQNSICQGPRTLQVVFYNKNGQKGPAPQGTGPYIAELLVARHNGHRQPAPVLQT
jgi:hypothetical protein